MAAEKDGWRRARRTFQVLALGLLRAGLAVSMSLGALGGMACRGKEGTGPDNGEKRPARAIVVPAEPNRPRHGHPAFQERTGERLRMVMQQIERREVKDPNVLAALRRVPRHAFVPGAQQVYAYEDRPLPIGQGQTISQPYIVAFMTETLQLDPNAVVLEIGTGSGYQAAVCAEIARDVYTIEIVESLAVSAAQVLAQLGYGNVHVRAGDGYHGWPEKGPFDAIIGTAAAREVPPPLLEQLKPGGRMILPVVGESGLQHLILATKDGQGRLQQRDVLPVRFVPMTGLSTRSAGPGAGRGN